MLRFPTFLAELEPSDKQERKIYMSRVVAREICMKFLYSNEINKSLEEEFRALNEESEDVSDMLGKGESLEKADFEYINSVMSSIGGKIGEVDKAIEENSKSWKISRFSKVDLSILRLATYEILYVEDIPHQVSINEAVKLAKKYGSDESHKFINGILGGLVRSRGLDKKE